MLNLRAADAPIVQYRTRSLPAHAPQQADRVYDHPQPPVHRFYIPHFKFIEGERVSVGQSSANIST